MAQETELQKALFQKQLQQFRAKVFPNESPPDVNQVERPITSGPSPEELTKQAEYTKQRGTETAQLIQAQAEKARRDAEIEAARQAKIAAQRQQLLIKQRQVSKSQQSSNYSPYIGQPLPGTAPVAGKFQITQEDTAEHSKGRGAHAWDFGVPKGTPVAATVNGTIIGVKDLGNKSYGKYIMVKGVDGKVYVYAHLGGFHVKVGQKVNARQVIGVSGSSGKSTGPHLHYEIRG